MYSTITNCRVCGSSELVGILDLGVQALTGVFPRDRHQQVSSGPLRLVKCVGGADACGLVQLAQTFELTEMYGLNYGYRSGLNPSMVRHLHGKVGKLLEMVKPPAGALIVDIGSNDSTTLQAYPARYSLMGVDPTGEKFKHHYPANISLVPDFFSAERLRREVGSRKASIITSFSMFYDLPDPLAFMRDIGEMLDDDGIWAFEQSYLPTMLERNSFDTICHEHLEYYTLRQIDWMAARVGLKLIDVELNDVNGGSFSVVAAKAGSALGRSPRIAELLERERMLALDTLGPYRQFAGRVGHRRDELCAFLEKAQRSGSSVCGLGASTKGNVLLQYCGIDERLLQRIGDVNEEKRGCFTPGSHIPIVGEEQVLAVNPDYLLVLPWHFRPFFLGEKKFGGRRLLFPLPELDIVTV